MNNKKIKLHWLLMIAAVLLVLIFFVIFTITGIDAPAAKVGLIMTGAATDDGWNGMHYNGVEFAHW